MKLVGIPTVTAQENIQKTRMFQHSFGFHNVVRDALHVSEAPLQLLYHTPLGYSKGRSTKISPRYWLRLWKRGNTQQWTKLCGHLAVVARAHQRRLNRLGTGCLLQCAAFAGRQQEAKKRDGCDAVARLEENDLAAAKIFAREAHMPARLDCTPDHDSALGFHKCSTLL